MTEAIEGGAVESLDTRLVEVALKLLETEGIERLTLRRIAREAGVSHGAPLRHFESLSDLRSEVAARGFRMLSDVVDRASRSLPAGAGPRARLWAAGRAYVEAAVANPGLFALMFRPDALDGANPRLAGEGAAAFEQLVRLVQSAQDAGFESERDPRTLAGSVWAAVHGLASLWSQGALTGAVPGARLEDALDITLGLVLGREPGEPA
ncbi:MAG: TetR/AcrR family transcriptional regulator [Myxococcota bacterium]|nr:TetR/AcrR family transcriptional regulator [Myxococcota bacterium]